MTWPFENDTSAITKKPIVHMSHVRDEKGIMKEEENHESVT